jgi:2-keto-4-pentenoate hydratase/2-oxohepta-3-ene-1,7-dioic acid hydratase in catechol pathway
MSSWARVQIQDRIVFGIVKGEQIDVFTGDMFDRPEPAGETIAVSDTQWLTPCVPKIFLALWNNFHAAAAKNNWTPPAEPLYFTKTANSYHPHNQPIPVPKNYDGRIFYEGELGIVIGRTARNLTVDQARDAIFGYTCVNDMTASDLFNRDPAFVQWTRAKNQDGFGVFGPVIATGIKAVELTVRTRINGRERQNYPVSDMIFSPADIVSHISRDITLSPGDIIACGTSLGLVPIKPGTRIEVEIDGIGILANCYGEVETQT